jgi:2-polyprenyl-3-methyl-5-hydroxy-6-metoxy-1,4-benzoquinol methylase
MSDSQQLNACPLCKNTQIRIKYNNLIDHIYGAKGRWRIYTCINCKLLFLNPRLYEIDISSAYKNYYTHNEINNITKSNINQYGWLKNIVKTIANNFLKVRLNIRPLSYSYYFSYLIILLIPYYRRLIEHQYRYIPAAKNGFTLLDYGCGSGLFLQKVKALGWNVTGVDFDQKAIKECRRLDLNAYVGEIGFFNEQTSLFDAITLSHVIEHIYDPRSFLLEIYRLLKPGGMLYIETPNSMALSHYLYGPNWRGLEPPRHISIFNWTNLHNLLLNCGFNKIERKYIYAKSNIIEVDSHCIQQISKIKFNSKWIYKYLYASKFLNFLVPYMTENIILVAHKHK